MGPKRRMIVVAGLCLGMLPSAPSLAGQGAPVEWMTIGKIMREIIYKGHEQTFYCGCPFVGEGEKAGSVDIASCGYRVRNKTVGGDGLSIDQIVPAPWLGLGHACWDEGHPDCVENGQPYAGRACCYEVDEAFRAAHNDMQNLVPAISEVHGDREFFKFGEIDGESRNYGSCDVEIDRRNRVTEPASHIRGDVARISLYMIDRYGIPVTQAYYQFLMDWDATDPPDKWEFERNARITAYQGIGNPWVERWKPEAKSEGPSAPGSAEKK